MKLCKALPPLMPDPFSQKNMQIDVVTATTAATTTACICSNRTKFTMQQMCVKSFVVVVLAVVTVTLWKC